MSTLPHRPARAATLIVRCRLVLLLVLLLNLVLPLRSAEASPVRPEPTPRPAAPDTSKKKQGTPNDQPAPISAAAAGALISNGVIQLGVNPEGHLINGSTGVLYLSTGNEGLANGCACEGWGAADALSGVTGYANLSTDRGVVNLSTVSFTSTDTIARSVVEIGSTLRVIHEYQPSDTINLYEVNVSIENISSAAVDARYRRVTDWDVAPTAFRELMTASADLVPTLLYNNNDGFATANPLGSRTSGTVSPVVTGDFADVGPTDQGALFDFGFGMLAPGATVDFRLFFGAALDNVAALAALGDVNAEAYSLARDTSSDTGRNVFIFGYEAISCFSETDCDGDGLTNAVERIWTGTSHTKPDTDGDGLLDPWEVDPSVPGAGFNLDDDAAIEASRDEVFGPYAETAGYIDGGTDYSGRITGHPFTNLVGVPDPLHKDIYLELDWQDCKLGKCPEMLGINIDPTHHAPSLTGLRDVVTMFDQAPVRNPDLSDGINLHILIDESIPHSHNCDRNDSAARPASFGTDDQRDDADLMRAKERVYRYIWSGHSTIRDDPASCPLPGGPSLLAQGVGISKLPDYDYSPFGDAQVSGKDILVSLGPLWICSSENKFNEDAAFSPCYREHIFSRGFLGFGGGYSMIPGIFPTKLDVNGSEKHFRYPIHRLLGVREDQAVQQLWGRTVAHLLGHSLGLEHDHQVGNKPGVPGADQNSDGQRDVVAPDSYTNWTDLQYLPTDSGTAGHEDDYPNYDELAGQDLDGDGTDEGEDNCPALSNPDQEDTNFNEKGDVCDFDPDGDGQGSGSDSVDGAGGEMAAAAVDPFPFDTDNDGRDNAQDNDDDNDGVNDNQDNCTIEPNPDQRDGDGDGQGDPCDLDADADMLPDRYEVELGSDPLSATSMPEYTGTPACSDGVDNDRDGQADSADSGCTDTDSDGLPNPADNCPLVANIDQRDSDSDGQGDLCDPTPLPPNTPPTVSAGGPYSVDEGAAVAVDAIVTDAEGGPFTFAWDLNGDGTYGGPGQTTTFSAATLDGPSTRPIGVEVVDREQFSVTGTTNVTIRNVAPTVTAISGPTAPFLAGSAIDTSATFTDPGRRDTHAATWSWGDGTTSTGTVKERDGSGTVTGSHVYTAAGTYTAVLTVTDKDSGATQSFLRDLVVLPVPDVRFSAADYSIGESAASATVTVNLSAALAEPISVGYATADGTATAGSDYYATNGTLTFAPGETSKTFTIALRGDSRDEPDETVALALSNPTNALLGTPASATLTISDDDTTPSVALSTASYTAQESVGTLNVTVRLSSASGYAVTVDYATSDGTATAGSDYTATTGTLTFAPGETSKTIGVPVLEDGLGEANETLSLRLSSPANATLGTTTTATLTISANDTLTLSTTAYTVQESAGTATITVRLNAASAQAVTVDYATSNGTATAGSDYTAASGTLTFAPGETSKTISVPVLEDGLGEANETIALALTNPTNAVLGSPATATLTISANDTLTFSTTGYTVQESAGMATVTVRLNAASALPVTVDYATSDGTATASDYSATSGTLTFAPGETSKTFTVVIADDLLGEANETVALALTNPTNAVLGSPATATLTISANDTLTLSSATYAVHENAGTATITVRLSGSSALPVTVDYATSDGTATAGSDYTAASGTLTFAPGETSKTFTVVIADDLLGEANETVALALTNPTNAVLGSPATATLTINANDTLTLSSATYAVHENAGTATVTVRLNAASAQTVTVDYATSDGTATAGSDYSATSGTLTFAPGETSKTFTVAVLEDGSGEVNETVAVALSTPTNAVLGTPATATLTINANDTLTLSSATYAVHENAGTATVTVRLNAASAQTVTVDYATSNGTATAGSDYSATSGTLTFAPGETSKTISVPVLEDGLGEANETIALALTNPTNAVLGTPATATLTISANDTLAFNTTGYTVQESAGTATVTVRLNAASAQTVTVDYATSNGTATAGSDYSATSGTLTFAPGETSKTFTVAVLEDGSGEANETVALTLTNPTNAVLGTPATATLTISANDTLTFSAASYSINEGTSTATVTVRLSGSSTLPVTVDYATSNGTATAGSDYSAASGTLTFAPGETSKTFTVAIINDTVDEPNETVALALTNPTNAVLGSPVTATLSIVDND